MKYSKDQLCIAIACLASAMLPKNFPVITGSDDEKADHARIFQTGAETLSELSACLVDPTRSTDKLDELSVHFDNNWLVNHNERGTVTMAFGWGGGDDGDHSEEVTYHLMVDAAEELETYLAE